MSEEDRMCAKCGTQVDNYGRCRNHKCEMDLQKQYKNLEKELPNRQPWKQPTKQSG